MHVHVSARRATQIDSDRLMQGSAVSRWNPAHSAESPSTVLGHPFSVKSNVHLIHYCFAVHDFTFCIAACLASFKIPTFRSYPVARTGDSFPILDPCPCSFLRRCISSPISPLLQSCSDILLALSSCAEPVGSLWHLYSPCRSAFHKRWLKSYKSSPILPSSILRITWVTRAWMLPTKFETPSL